MRYPSAATSAALLIAGATAALAQGTQAPSETKMSKAECQAIWSKADSAQNESLTMSQAAPYISNFKAVDTNNDEKISSSEFMSGCARGLAHDTESTGAGAGESGKAQPRRY